MGSRARQLEADNMRLSETNRLKDVFLSTATHELKTPLTSVIAYAELLGESAGSLSDEQQGEFLGRLRGEAQRLLSLIEDILDLSRIESGKMPLNRRHVSVESLARDAVETSRSLAEKFGVEIEIAIEDELPRIPLDEVKMRQVFVNLLVNAVKFSPEGATVALRVRRSEGDAVIEVVDRGPGVAPEEATYIFELFGQGVGADDEAKGGLGIGLHLVKRITELHGGHVGVNSRPGEGSTFWVRLPLALAALPETGEEAEKAA
jgi:signal transduction histidine kinase